jgi:hypothetical protein
MTLHAPERQTTALVEAVHGPSPLAYPQRPSVSHTAERHTTSPFVIEQGPSSLAKPHLLSEKSQTPLWQTKIAAGPEHVPLSTGLVCEGSFGIGWPFASTGTQAWTDSLHQLPVEQSESTTQPPLAMQTPVTLHTPERQTVVAFEAVHGPSLLA